MNCHDQKYTDDWMAKLKKMCLLSLLHTSLMLLPSVIPSVKLFDEPNQICSAPIQF